MSNGTEDFSLETTIVGDKDNGDKDIGDDTDGERCDDEDIDDEHCGGEHSVEVEGNNDEDNGGKVSIDKGCSVVEGIDDDDIGGTCEDDGKDGICIGNSNNSEALFEEQLDVAFG